jgi:hypothetical protein
MRRFVLLTLAVAVALPAAGAPKDKKKEKAKSETTVSVTIGFSVEQIETVRGYNVKKHGRGNCPPGLAKKNNGCLPPGQAKKRYAVGKPLPHGVKWHPVPADLEARLGRPPEGYLYAVVDGDVAKLVVGTLQVVDAIDGLVR